jgi:hypothetical protein
MIWGLSPGRRPVGARGLGPSHAEHSRYNGPAARPSSHSRDAPGVPMRKALRHRLKRPTCGLEEKKPPLEAGEGRLISHAAARDAAAADIIAPSIRRHCRKFPNIWLFPPFGLPQACSTAAASKNECAQIGARDAMGAAPLQQGLVNSQCGPVAFGFRGTMAEFENAARMLFCSTVVASHESVAPP